MMSTLTHETESDRCNAKTKANTQFKQDSDTVFCPLYPSPETHAQ